MGYKTADPDAPYGLTKGGKPRKRPGPPKGGQKVPLSGRKPRDFKGDMLKRIYDYVAAGLAGEPVLQGGPTGKQIRAPLSQDNQVKLVTTTWRKLEPDLAAQAVRAEIETSEVGAERVDNRHLARTILSILGEAQLEEEAAQPQPPPMPQPQLLLGRDDVIEVSAGQPEAAPSAPVGFHGDERKDNRAVMPSSGPKVVRRMPRRIR